MTLSKSTRAYLATIGARGGAVTSPEKRAHLARIAKLPRRRYCEMCDTWMRAKECKACGAETVKVTA